MAGTSHAVAKIAVSAATYWIDRPYDYLVPEELAEKAVPGARVYVPFARGNRRSEGIILALSDHSEFKQLKPILAVLDEEPVLTGEQIRLALFMRERFFCTDYEAVKTILPAGLWFREDGTQRVKDKTVEMARLAVPAEVGNLRGPGAEAAESVVLPVLVGGEHDIHIIVLLHGADHVRDGLGPVLQIIVHGDDKIAADAGKPAQNGGRLPEVSGQLDNAHAAVERVKPLHQGIGTVFGSVIHQDQLKILFQNLVENGAEPFMQGLERMLGIVYRNDYGISAHRMGCSLSLEFTEKTLNSRFYAGKHLEWLFV